MLESNVPAGQAWLSAQQIKDAHIDVTPVVLHDVGGAIVTSGRVTFDDLRVSHVSSPGKRSRREDPRPTPASA